MFAATHLVATPGSWCCVPMTSQPRQCARQSRRWRPTQRLGALTGFVAVVQCGLLRVRRTWGAEAL